MLCIQYLQICGRVLMASEQVLMSRLRVLMSRPPVRVASRQVLMRYELTISSLRATAPSGLRIARLRLAGGGGLEDLLDPDAQVVAHDDQVSGGESGAPQEQIDRLADLAV